MYLWVLLPSFIYKVKCFVIISSIRTRRHSVRLRIVTHVQVLEYLLNLILLRFNHALIVLNRVVIVILRHHIHFFNYHIYRVWLIINYKLTCSEILLFKKLGGVITCTDILRRLLFVMMMLEFIFLRFWILIDLHVGRIFANICLMLDNRHL